MIQITPQMRILVAIEAVDGRKGIDSLVRLCQERLQADPFSGWLFLFRSRKHRSGFWFMTAKGSGWHKTNSLHTTPPPVLAQYVEGPPAHLSLDPPTGPIDCNV